ncbi:MAG: CPBP family intramembrane metalloprotease [Candidatus Omnitrophica bacterium]|nr:CPBP family intramembrane metalloprotease [Candidatus Omnitrophota bacterium]
MAQAAGSPKPLAHALQPRAVSGWWSVITFGLLTFAISVLLSVIVWPFVGLPWWKVFRRCVSIGAAASVLICVKVLERRTVRSYGFADAGKGMRQLLFGVVLGASTLAAMFGIGLWSGAYHVSIDESPLKFWGTIIGLMPAMALVSVLEELVFRGVILQRLIVYSRPVAMFVSSALYAIVHLKTLAPTWSPWGPWFELFGLFLFGMILCVSFFLTGQLYLAVGLHASLAYGARVNKLLVEFPRPALNWLIGTNRLVNGVMNWMALLAMCGVMVWWVRSSQQQPKARAFGIPRRVE